MKKMGKMGKMGRWVVACILAPAVLAKPVSLPDELLEPDLAQPLRTIDSNGVSITIYAAKKTEQPVALEARDPTVFTAGSGDAPYYYPQNPTATTIELRAESNYYDLSKSKTLAVQLDDLQPNTVYFYRVADSVEINRFKTTPAPGEFAPFRFVVIGDTQGPYDHARDNELNKDELVMAPFPEANLPVNAQFNRVTDSIRRSNVKPDFIAHVGDIVEDARYWVQWSREQFSDLKYLLTMAPVYPIMGNHEYHDPRFHRYFNLPIPADEHAADPERPFFSYDWGDAHFIFLDMNGGWYTIYDIDDVPEGTGTSYDIDGQPHYYDVKQIRGGSSYAINDNTLNRLRGHLADDQIARLQPLKGKEVPRATLQQQLRDLGFNADEDRQIRTAAIECYKSNVANCRVGIAVYGSPVQEAQIKWVRKDLEANKDKKYIFAFTHHPQLYGTSENKQFIELYEQYRVSAIFSGHLHLYSHHLRNGVHYFQSGGGSDETYTALVDKQPDTFVMHRYGSQYMVLDVREDHAIALGVDERNRVFERTVIAPRDAPPDFVPTATPAADEASPKKLINHGWGITDTAYLRAHIRDMEKEPFEGLSFRLMGWTPDGGEYQGYHPMTSKKWERGYFDQAFDDLEHTAFDTFTDNFVSFYLGADKGFDLFNDAHWEATLHNLEIIIDAAKLAKCKGFVIDPENYATATWKLGSNDPADFDRTCAEVRRRGRQFIEFIQTRMPDATLLFLFMPSYLDKFGALDSDDPDSILIGLEYGLLPAFTNGMLDGIGPDITIVDGSEATYKAQTPEDFVRLRHAMKEKALHLIAPENREKYRRQVQAGHGIWPLKSCRGRFPATDEAKQWEKVVYHALETSDEYVWCYHECWFWWPKHHRMLPRGANEAILNAKDRIAGVDPETLRDLSMAPAAGKQLKLSRATIPARPTNVSAPTIDGELTDPAWQSAVHLPRFIRQKRMYAPRPDSEAWVTYDDDNLYVAILCHEPQMDKLRPVGESRDSRIDNGDSVDLFLSTSTEPVPFYHFVVNPNNVQADLLSDMQWDRVQEDMAAYNGKWQSATQKYDDRWTVEIALPWSEIGLTARAVNTELRANLTRSQRGPVYQNSSWSPTIANGNEPYNFGTWIFGPPGSAAQQPGGGSRSLWMKTPEAK